MIIFINRLANDVSEKAAAANSLSQFCSEPAVTMAPNLSIYSRINQRTVQREDFK